MRARLALGGLIAAAVATGLPACSLSAAHPAAAVSSPAVGR
jgi:hypothetical protein